MKLHASTLSALNTFTGYGPGFVLVNDERRETSVIVMPEHLQPWDAADFASLEAAHFVDNPASGRVLEKLGFLGTGLSAPRHSCARGEEVVSKLYRLALAEREEAIAA